MELKEGHMTLRELSVWFGLKPETISNSRPSAKQKKLDKLKLFCDYHFDGKKLMIDRVYIPEYTKAYDFIESRFQDEWGLVIDHETRKANWQKNARVDTCTRVGKAMHGKYPEVKQIQESTAISYVGAVKRDKFGRNCVEEHKQWGSCRIVYLNEDYSGLLSEDQMAILKQCRQEAYANVSEKIAVIDESCAMRDITTAEAKVLKGEIDTNGNYNKYQELLFERLGFIPKKMTQIEWEQNWKDKEE